MAEEALLSNLDLEYCYYSKYVYRRDKSGTRIYHVEAFHGRGWSTVKLYYYYSGRTTADIVITVARERSRYYVKVLIRWPFFGFSEEELRKSLKRSLVERELTKQQYEKILNEITKVIH